MKHKRETALISLTITFITACGGAPLAQPEENASAPRAPVKEVSKEIAIVQPESPLAPPTATAKSVKETPVPISTPAPIYSPTPAPSPTPTPTFEPLSDKPIQGYVFGEPVELQNLDDSVIRGWVPGSDEKIIIVGGNFLATYNILTQEKKRLAEWDAETRSVIGDPVWLVSANTVALILGNLETKQYELWTSVSGAEPAKQPTLTNIERSFIPITTDMGLGVYDLNSNSPKPIFDNEEVSHTETIPLPETSKTTSSSPYRISSYGDWTVYYNQDNFFIIDQEKKEAEEVNLVDGQGHPLHTWDVQWSWDGSKLALLLSKDIPPRAYGYLYVYDLKSGSLQEVKTPFAHYIDAISWGPDNRHMMVSAVIGEAEYKTPYGDSFTSAKQALYLVDTTTMENSPVPIHFPEIASSVGRVLWSPDGKYLITKYRFYEGEILVYRVEVRPA